MSNLTRRAVHSPVDSPFGGDRREQTATFGNLRRLYDYTVSSLEIGATYFDRLFLFRKQFKNLSVRLGLTRHHPHEQYSVGTKFGRLYFRDNFGDITNLGNIFTRKVYRYERLDVPGAILDVGANIGLAGAWFSHFNPHKSLYCFEPIKENLELAKLNCPAAELVEAAVGSDEGLVTLNCDKDDVMATSIPTTWETEARQFRRITLDGYCGEQGIEDVALLKIDVEGMENEVLLGADRILVKTAIVAMETHGKGRHEWCRQRLIERGFEIESETFAEDTGMIFAVRT